MVSASEQEPWCSSCEWNLDAEPDYAGYSWFWRRIARADRRAGFRADRALATSTGEVTGGAHAVLVSVSVLILLVQAAVAGLGLWLISAVGHFGPVVVGLLLIGFALWLLPWPGRLKPLLDCGYRVEKQQAPTLHRLIELIGEQVGAPTPDVLVLDFAWNASAAEVGLRRTKVLVLGIPLLLALRPPQVVALIGHELGHLKHSDAGRSLITAPARRTLGRLSRMVRPPVGIGSGYVSLPLMVWQLIAGVVSWVLYAGHLAINVLASGDDRRLELRADAMAKEAAGTTAALEVLDVLALSTVLVDHLQRHVPEGEAAVSWRELLRVVREREAEALPVWRQLSIRANPSIFGTHPSAGRRHQWLAAQPEQQPSVIVDAAAGERIEHEIAPFAEAMHRTMMNRAAE